MTSKISILRKFFNLELKDHRCDYESSNHNFIFRYYTYQSTYSRSLFVRPNFYREKYILDYRNNVDLYLNDMGSNIKIDDIDDFKNFDDTSLVLRYGRDILDDNIVRFMNKLIEYKIMMHDFDVFLNHNNGI